MPLATRSRARLLNVAASNCDAATHCCDKRYSLVFQPLRSLRCETLRHLAPQRLHCCDCSTAGRMRRARKPRAEPRGPSPQRLCCLLAFCLLAVVRAALVQGTPARQPTTPYNLAARPPPAHACYGDGLVSQWTEIASLSWYHTDKLDKDELAERRQRRRTRPN